MKNLIDRYPQSTYIDDAHYTLAINYFRSGRYEDAASECIIVLQTSHEKKLTERSEKLVEALASSYLTLSELQQLQPDAKSEEMKSLVTVRIAEKLLRIGDVSTAEEMLHKIASLPPKIKYVSDALALLEQMENRGMKIGVILPLMLKAESPLTRALGVEFLEGIRLAVDEYNQKMPVKIFLDVHDTERDPSIAARLVADLCTDEKVSAIIGPISSNEVFASAGIANERGVPLITPTATANGIAIIGPFIFRQIQIMKCGAAMRRHLLTKHSALGILLCLLRRMLSGKQMAESFVCRSRFVRR